MGAACDLRDRYYANLHRMIMRSVERGMLFLNENEALAVSERYYNDPILGPATQLLLRVIDLANNNSDGWCYWRPPIKACKQLMQLIKGEISKTEDNFRRAQTPIKAFCTRHGFHFPSAEQVALQKLGGSDSFVKRYDTYVEHERG